MIAKQSWHRKWTTLGIAAGIAAASACTDQTSAAQLRAQTSAELTDSAVLARVGDDPLRLSDVRTRVGDQLDQLETKYKQDRFKITEAALQQIVRDRVLALAAKQQRKTIDEMLLNEAGAIEPTDADVTTWYSANQARLNGRTLDQLRPQIVDYLRDERRRVAAAKVEDRFRKAGQLTVYLEPFRVTLDNTGAPATGATNSTVTLVEFSDFQCPYCRRFVPTLHQVRDVYGSRVNIVYRQYPIPSLHPFAEKAAEASLCANEQGKFWELHDLMFQEQDKLTVEDLKAKATRLGLDRAKFAACLDGGRYAKQVADDVKEGTRAGVTGTPAIFVNGVPVEGGAVAFEVVARALDSELARVKR